MTKLEALRSRYMKDPVSVRLGGLAANLARVASFSRHDAHQEAVLSILREGKWFIEWTAPVLDMEDRADLVRLQVQVALWDLQCPGKWSDGDWRQSLAAESERWSQRVLSMSGLLETISE